MENIFKLLNRIDTHLESKNTQELILDLDNSEKATQRAKEAKEKLRLEVEELQSLIDDPSNVDFIVENYKILSESFESVYFNTDISLEQLKNNLIGKEELYKYISNLIQRKN